MIEASLRRVRGNCRSVIAYNIVMGALSDEGAPLFSVARPAGAFATDADVEPLFKAVI